MDPRDPRARHRAGIWDREGRHHMITLFWFTEPPSDVGLDALAYRYGMLHWHFKKNFDDAQYCHSMVAVLRASISGGCRFDLEPLALIHVLRAKAIAHVFEVTEADVT